MPARLIIITKQSIYRNLIVTKLKMIIIDNKIAGTRFLTFVSVSMVKIYI